MALASMLLEDGCLDFGDQVLDLGLGDESLALASESSFDPVLECELPGLDYLCVVQEINDSVKARYC